MTDNSIFSNAGIPEADLEYEFFKEEFRTRTGILLGLYKEKQMKRRINTLIERKELKDYHEFLALLDSNENEMKEFIDYITINVTEFFRTPDHWQNFEKEVLEKLISSSKAKIRIWSSACSTGEEPYSIAISIAERTGDLSRFEIIASDIDETVLAQAEKGIFSNDSVAVLPKNIKEKYFTETEEGWSVNELLRDMVKFRKTDLLQDEFPENCDAILSRNILIYFTDIAKDRLYERYYESLASGGYLFTGNAEQLVYYRKFGYQRIAGYLYKKPEEKEENGNHEEKFCF